MPIMYACISMIKLSLAVGPTETEEEDLPLGNVFILELGPLLAKQECTTTAD